MSHEDYVHSQQAKVVDIASKMIDGQIGIIDGSRQLSRLRNSVSDLDFDEDFMVFVAIDSETDDLPVGSERQYWADSALAMKDQEIKDAELSFREQALTGCKRLIERFNAA
jgi:hypothetical protein